MASNRHLSRIITLQSLYEYDFQTMKMGVKLDPKTDLDKIVDKNYQEFGRGIENKDFIYTLLSGIMEVRDRIDSIIEPAAPEWPIPQIALVDLETLRIGIYELLFLKEVPPKVAINEAVEIAKAFGGENSSRFVNGVLGTVYRNSDVYNPDDDKKRVENTEGISEIDSAGGLVYREFGNKLFFLLIKDRFDKWSVPKGRVEDGEKVEVAAKRETEEETGLRSIELIDKLGGFQLVSKKGKDKFLKNVNVFLFKTKEEKLDISKVADEEVKDLAWFTNEEIKKESNCYDNTKELIATATEKIG